MVNDVEQRTEQEGAQVELPEVRSPRAARILAAADALLLAHGSRGFSVADVAQKAHVGKGTVYLYWATKEDLLLGLIGRDFLAVADSVSDALSADSQLARPSRFCPYLLRSTGERTLVKALQDNDEGLLGMLAAHPRTMMLRDALGPGALMSTVLPSWRRNDLARTDWDVGAQMVALNAVIAGFQLAVRESIALAAGGDPYSVMAATVTAVLGPERATSAQARAAATDIAQFLQHGRKDVLNLIGQPVNSHADKPSRGIER